MESPIEHNPKPHVWTPRMADEIPMCSCAYCQRTHAIHSVGIKIDQVSEGIHRLARVFEKHWGIEPMP